jgi:hypothetical protein
MIRGIFGWESGGGSGFLEEGRKERGSTGKGKGERGGGWREGGLGEERRRGI